MQCCQGTPNKYKGTWLASLSLHYDLLQPREPFFVCKWTFASHAQYLHRYVSKSNCISSASAPAP
jgi:hypothetical protein